MGIIAKASSPNSRPKTSTIIIKKKELYKFQIIMDGRIRMRTNVLHYLLDTSEILLTLRRYYSMVDVKQLNNVNSDSFLF